MAALTTDRYPLMWQDGQSDRVALYALRDITTGDTLDLAEQFTILKRGSLVGTTIAATASASISGTVLTIPSGVNRDGAYALVYGVAR
jgi:hypothetical protein